MQTGKVSGGSVNFQQQFLSSRKYNHEEERTEGRTQQNGKKRCHNEIPVDTPMKAKEINGKAQEGNQETRGRVREAHCNGRFKQETCDTILTKRTPLDK